MASSAPAKTRDRVQRPEAQHAGGEIVSALIPTDIVIRLRAAARENDRSVSSEVRQALRAWFAYQQARGAVDE